MENTMTPEEGNGLTVNEAAGQLLSMLGDEEDAPEEGQAEESTEADEPTEEDVDTSDEVEEESDEPVYHVKMAGEDREITQSELIKLAQQGADYTKKSQQVAEARKQVEAEAKVIAEARKERDDYSQRLQAIRDYLEQATPNENLAELKESDPIGYAVRVAELTQQKEQIAAIKAEQDRIEQIQQAEQAQQQRAYLSQQAQLVSELIPDYADAQKGAKMREELRAYAKSIGYSDAEVNTVTDARTVKALYDAMQYANLQKAKPDVTKKVNQAPKVLKSGVAQSKQSNTEQAKRNHAQLQKTGKVRDAARIFENFI